MTPTAPTTDTHAPGADTGPTLSPGGLGLPGVATADDLWLIVLKPLPHDVPAAVRVRRWLKLALRAYRLRCVTVRSPTPAEVAEAENQRHPGGRNQDAETELRIAPEAREGPEEDPAPVTSAQAAADGPP